MQAESRQSAEAREEMKNQGVARGASRMGLATLLSRILGLMREQVFAFLFGASNAADAFNVAFRIPNLLRDLFAEGAMSAAFVPNFARSLVQSRASAFRLLAGTLSVLVVIVSSLSILGIIFSKQLVTLYAGSYRAIPGKLELATGLTQIMFPFFPLVAMAAVVMGALNALGSFFLPAFAPVLFNVASIFAGFVICPLLGRYTHFPPIYGMAFGVVGGGFLQFYVQWLQMKREGFRYKGQLPVILRPWREPGVRSVLWLLVPGTVGLAATQLGILINSIYATRAGTGAVSWLNYAFRLMQFPIGIFGVSLAAATLPMVSRKLAQNDLKGAGEEVNNSLRMSFAVNGPAAAGLMAAGLPIVQLLFQHGRFGITDAHATARAVFWYAAGLPAYSAVKVLVPVFYALRDTRIPVLVSFASVALTAILNHVLLDVFQYPFWCLAAALSLGSTLNALILALLLSRRLPYAVNGKLARSVASHALISAMIAVTVEFVVHRLESLEIWFQALIGGRFIFWGGQLLAALFVAILLWIFLGMSLGIEENKKATLFFLKKLRRSA